MQPLCPLHLGLSTPPSSVGKAVSGLACLEQCEEKQLFERFWKGTSKAVATPRPQSIIMASITTRRRVIDIETSTCQADEKKVEADDIQVDSTKKEKRRKHGSHRRTRCGSFEQDLSPRSALKGKKKKRKSERKRKSKRSPSYSLSPIRKKKKKKKKSSKRNKRHRYTYKKSKHSSSSQKRKRKDVRQHKKSSRTHSHQRRRYQRSESRSSSYQSSSMENRYNRDKPVEPCPMGKLFAPRENNDASLDPKGIGWGSVAKSVCKTAPNYRSILPKSTILQSKPGQNLLSVKAIHRQSLSNRIQGRHDFDSGNDTSSPPSTKKGVSHANVSEEKRTQCQALKSSDKLKVTDGDNASDSGNSVTSIASLCKPQVEGGPLASVFNGNSMSEPIIFGCQLGVVRLQKKAISPARALSYSHQCCARAQSPSSRSSTRSSWSSQHSHRYSQSRSSTGRSYSRSPSYLADWKRGVSVASVSSRKSYSRYSPDRLRHRKRKLSPREKDRKQKGRMKQQRRKSYSPIKKRRRDSPSHLEARRITSARKRPIPYFRPSPSSSSRSTSVSSWNSPFTRSRSPSRSTGGGRSRSLSQSDFSYRSYSRSSSWNSIFGARNRSCSRSTYSSSNHYSRH